MSNYREDFSTLNHWEYFEHLVKQDLEEKKQIEDLCRIMEDRVNIEDQYLRGIERVISGLEQINFRGSLSEVASHIIFAHKERLAVGRSYMFLVKKDSLESIREMIKRQTSDTKTWVSEQKRMEKEYKSCLERVEKLKNAYISQAKECDLAGLEAQTANANREITTEKRVKATQKHIECIKMKVDNEEIYQAKVLEHNTFLDRFKSYLENFNRNLLDSKASTLQTVKQTMARLLDFEKTQSLVYTKALEPLYSEVETVDVMKITKDLASSFVTTKPFPLKLAPIVYHSFFQQTLNELQIQNNGTDKEIITSFRRFHEDRIRCDQIQDDQPFECENLHKNDNENVCLVSSVLDNAWRGEQILLENMQKFQQLLREKFLRNIFIAGLQQYRLAGKFTLNFNGFKSMKTILYYFLDECLKAKDVVNTTKVMILSLTFWKVVSQQDKQDEKKYLQASVKWHPIWKELDFWTAAIFYSIHEEVVRKRSFKLEEQESEKETRERQKAIVCGQLLSYIHNMVSFGVEKGDVKRIIRQFCQYYTLDELNVKELLITCDDISTKKENTDMIEAQTKRGAAELPKKKGFDSIRDFFTKRTINSPELNLDNKSATKNGAQVPESKPERKASDILKTENENHSETTNLGMNEDP